MEYLVGLLAALGVGLGASWVGFDRERGFYAVVLIVIASYYLLFAAMASSLGVLVAELVPASLFVLIAVLGFRWSPWLVVVGLAGHGVFDFVHPELMHNPGVPLWWPGFCLAYDVTAAAYLAALIVRRGRAGQ